MTVEEWLQAQNARRCESVAIESEAASRPGNRCVYYRTPRQQFDLLRRGLDRPEWIASQWHQMHLQQAVPQISQLQRDGERIANASDPDAVSREVLRNNYGSGAVLNPPAR